VVGTPRRRRPTSNPRLSAESTDGSASHPHRVDTKGALLPFHIPNFEFHIRAKRANASPQASHFKSAPQRGIDGRLGEPSQPRRYEGHASSIPHSKFRISHSREARKRLAVGVPLQIRASARDRRTARRAIPTEWLRRARFCHSAFRISNSTFPQQAGSSSISNSASRQWPFLHELRW